jgi:hypothetical protein
LEEKKIKGLEGICQFGKDIWNIRVDNLLFQASNQYGRTVPDIYGTIYTYVLNIYNCIFRFISKYKGNYLFEPSASAFSKENNAIQNLELVVVDQFLKSRATVPFINVLY